MEEKYFEMIERTTNTSYHYSIDRAYACADRTIYVVIVSMAKFRSNPHILYEVFMREQ